MGLRTGKNNKNVEAQLLAGRYEDALSSLLQPRIPDPEFVRRLKTRLTVPPAVSLENPTSNHQVLLHAAGIIVLIAGVIFILRRILQAKNK